VDRKLIFLRSPRGIIHGNFNTIACVAIKMNLFGGGGGTGGLNFYLDLTF
jgi:hypothetical protein